MNKKLQKGLIAGAFTMLASGANAQNVFDFIANSNDHTILESALRETNLNQTLSGTGNFTVFAPTDDAFVSLTGAASVEEARTAVLALDDLSNILLNHVLGSTELSTGLSDGDVQTLTDSGYDITIDVTSTPGSVFVDNAQVTNADNEESNGVVHVIDDILIPSYDDVTEVVIASDDHTLLAYALTQAGLVDDLQTIGAATVFAPTNAAFVKLGINDEAGVDALITNLGASAVTSLLQKHVVAETVLAENLSTGTQSTLSEDVSIDINTGGAPEIDGAVVSATDIVAGNGVVHVLDDVIKLNAIKNNFDIVKGSTVHNVLQEALEVADLVDAINDDANPVTIFAPTDGAFAQLLVDLDLTKEALFSDVDLLTEVLTYHVVSGTVLSTGLSNGDVPTLNDGNSVTISTTGPTVNGANIGPTDLTSTSGVIHVIDEVLVPSDLSLPATVTEIATSNSNFSILVEALTAANLVTTVSDPDASLTVFAPTNDAFGQLLEDLDLTKEALFANTELLTEVLTYHVINDKVTSDELTTVDVATVNTETVSIDAEAGTVDGITIETVDLLAGNGVVHVIETVLVPSTLSLPGTVTDIATSNSDFSILVEALTAADLVGAVSDPDASLTVFAPTNAAFTQLLADLDLTKEALFANTDLLTEVLTYHVIADKVTSDELTNGDVAMLNTETVTIDADAGTVDGIDIETTDLLAGNGVVHVIETVLVPSTLSLPATVTDIATSNSDFSILVEALTAADLVTAVRDPEASLTVFAPTNDAFVQLLEDLDLSKEALFNNTALLKEVLTYHVIADKVTSDELTTGDVATLNIETVSIDADAGTVDGITIETVDLLAGNGVVHVIETVLVPSTLSLPATVADIATSNDDFSILVEALTAADLVGAVSDPDASLTVFAPTNAAFTQLLTDLGITKEQLLADTDLLTSVLTYHVIGDKVTADELESGTVETLNGLFSTIDADAAKVDGIDIVTTDLLAGNGVVHVIETVLSPDNGVTSVFTPNTLELIMFPNPTSDFVNIEMNENILNVSIMSLDGQLIRSIENTSQINVSDLDAGAYIIGVNTNNNQFTSKLIKE